MDFSGVASAAAVSTIKKTLQEQDDAGAAAPKPFSYEEWLAREQEEFEELRTYHLPLGTFEEYTFSDNTASSNRKDSKDKDKESYMFDRWYVSYMPPPKYKRKKQQQQTEYQSAKAREVRFTGVPLLTERFEGLATPPHNMLCTRLEPYPLEEALNAGYRNLHKIGAVFGLDPADLARKLSCEFEPRMLDANESSDELNYIFMNARCLPCLPLYWVDFTAAFGDHTRFRELSASAKLLEVTKLHSLVSLPMTMQRLKYLISYTLRIPLSYVTTCMDMQNRQRATTDWCQGEYVWPYEQAEMTPGQKMLHAFDYAKKYVRLIASKLEVEMSHMQSIVPGLNKQLQLQHQQQQPTEQQRQQKISEAVSKNYNLHRNDKREHDNMPDIWVRWVRHPETIRYFTYPVMEDLAVYFDRAQLLGLTVEQVYDLHDIVIGNSGRDEQQKCGPLSGAMALLLPGQRLFFKRCFQDNSHDQWLPGYCDLSSFISYPHCLTRRIRPTSIQELQLFNLFESVPKGIPATGIEQTNEHRPNNMAKSLDFDTLFTILVYHVIKWSYAQNYHAMIRMKDVLARVRLFMAFNTEADVAVLDSTLDERDLKPFQYDPLQSICTSLFQLLLCKYKECHMRGAGSQHLVTDRYLLPLVKQSLLWLAHPKMLGGGCIVLQTRYNRPWLPSYEPSMDCIMDSDLWDGIRIYTSISYLSKQAIVAGYRHVFDNSVREQRYSETDGGHVRVHPFAHHAWRQRWDKPLFNMMSELCSQVKDDWLCFSCDDPWTQIYGQQEQIEFGQHLDEDTRQTVLCSAVKHGWVVNSEDMTEERWDYVTREWRLLWQHLVAFGLPDPPPPISAGRLYFKPCSEQLMACEGTRCAVLPIMGQGGGGKSVIVGNIFTYPFNPQKYQLQCQDEYNDQVTGTMCSRVPDHLKRVVVASHSNHSYNFRRTMSSLSDKCGAEGKDYYIGTLHKLLSRHRAMCLNRKSLAQCPESEKAIKRRWRAEQELGYSPWSLVEQNCERCPMEHLECVYLEEIGVMNDNDFQQFMSMLRKCCPRLTHMGVLGDIDQLPPIGPGHIARDSLLGVGSNIVQHKHRVVAQELAAAQDKVLAGDTNIRWANGCSMFYFPCDEIANKDHAGILKARREKLRHPSDELVKQFEKAFDCGFTMTQAYHRSIMICWTRTLRDITAAEIDGLYLRARARDLGEEQKLWEHLTKAGKPLPDTYYAGQKIICKTNNLEGATTNQVLIVYDVLEGFIEHTPYTEVADLKDKMFKSLVQQLRSIAVAEPTEPSQAWLRRLIDQNQVSLERDVRRWTRTFLQRQKQAQNLEATALQDLRHYCQQQVNAMINGSEGPLITPAIAHSIMMYHPDTYDLRMLKCAAPELMSQAPGDDDDAISCEISETWLQQEMERLFLENHAGQVDRFGDEYTVESIKEHERHMFIHNVHIWTHEAIKDLQHEQQLNGGSSSSSSGGEGSLDGWVRCRAPQRAPAAPFKFYTACEELTREQVQHIERQMAPPTSTLRQMLSRALDGSGQYNTMVTENDDLRFRCTRRLPHSSASVHELRQKNKMGPRGSMVATKLLRCYPLGDPNTVVWIPCDWSETACLDIGQLSPGSVQTIYSAQSTGSDIVAMIIDRVLDAETMYMCIGRTRRKFLMFAPLRLVNESIKKFITPRLSTTWMEIRDAMIQSGAVFDYSEESLQYIRRLQKDHVSGEADDHIGGGGGELVSFGSAERYRRTQAFTYPMYQRMPKMSPPQQQLIMSLQQENSAFAYYDQLGLPYNIYQLTHEQAQRLDDPSNDEGTTYLVELDSDSEPEAAAAS